MNSPPLASVIVLNYNGKHFLETCLTSLQKQTYPNLEVILVDNASTDGSIEYVKEHFATIEVIENKKNQGFAKGNNIGVEVAKGEYVLTLNNDTRADPSWVEELVKTAESDFSIGMCASKMLFMDRSDTINSAGINISRSGACWDRGLYAPSSSYTEPDEVFGPCAGAALYRRKMLDEVGLFDEDFFIYMEDVDLAFRGRLAGWRCVYVPSAIVYHHHGGFGGIDSDFTIYYGNRNIVWNAFKNFPTGILITSLPWIVGRNLVVIPYYTVRGHGKVIIKSKIDAVKGLPKILKKRKVQKKIVDVPNKIERFIKTWSSVKKPKE